MHDRVFTSVEIFNSVSQVVDLCGKWQVSFKSLRGSKGSGYYQTVTKGGSGIASERPEISYNVATGVEGHYDARPRKKRVAKH